MLMIMAQKCEVGNTYRRLGAYLHLINILPERTDDEHILNASVRCTILDQGYGISTDRRTIYTEIETLQKFVNGR